MDRAGAVTQRRENCFVERRRRNQVTDKPKIALSRTILLAVASLLLLPSYSGEAQQPANPAEAAGQIADFFGKVGDQIYENCIFELSDEQIEVQHALVDAYIEHGASGAAARKLAANQIQPPKLSVECEQIRNMPRLAPPPPPTEAATPPAAWEPKIAAAPKPKAPPTPPARAISLASKKVLPQWDCAEGVDYVTIQHKGYLRKLTGGEICNPFQDVVHEVPAAVGNFRLGYTIKTGRLFVITEGGARGQTIAWAISGREVCRNNPDPDCLATRAVGPLPPGEYAFSANKDQRITWGPTIKRYVVGIYLKKLWGKERFTPQQTAAILARGNIAIHERLKGEMSEACLGLEPNGWAYVASLIKNARATGLNVYIDEPYPQVAENPPVVVASSFSLTSLFK
ncbi:hypothetical protein HYPDE_25153 [Hyphomicrobium denitrificans 1NES1]|uniref:DUF2778 domain-containing protein n=1 Tax=Hyphomicrobium denitrificans 1NES1 TaxID=670307 RepID=N0B9G2_9HYPH|nr:hypothetical protein HYPDE_25153 [Hyphomicrobium denitrificans 1NES1]